MFGNRYTGEEQEAASLNTNWNNAIAKSLRDATKNRKIIWRRERHGDEYSTTIVADGKKYILFFGSVPNRARKPPVVHFLKIIFDLGDITILEPDQGKGIFKTSYRNETEAETARSIRELSVEINNQVKSNEAQIQKDTGPILQRISSALT